MMNEQAAERLKIIERAINWYKEGYITKTELNNVTNELLQEVRCIYSSAILN